MAISSVYLQTPYPLHAPVMQLAPASPTTCSYSADHKERAFEFCLGSGKPWALLLPNYVANKVCLQLH